MFKSSTSLKLLDWALLLSAALCLFEVLLWSLNYATKMNSPVLAYWELGTLLVALGIFLSLLVYRLRSKQVSAMGIALDHAANLSGVGYLHYFPKQGRWIANHVAQALLKRPAPQFSASLDEVLQRVHPADLEAAGAAAQSVLQGSEPVSGVVRLGDTSKGYVHVRFYAYRLQDGSVAVSMVDIEYANEARRLAERNEARLQEALKAARATRFEIDLNTGELVAPALAREAVGLMPGGTLNELIDCVDEEYQDDLHLRFEQRTAFENLYPITHDDGAKRWFRFTANVELDSKINLTLVDLTEQKEFEFEQRETLKQIQAASRIAKLSIYTENFATGELVEVYRDPDQLFDFVGGEQLLLRTPTEHHAAIADANRVSGKVIETPYVDDGGAHFWLRYSIVATSENGRTLLIQDITDLAEQRQDLQDSLDEVEMVRQDLQKRSERERQMFAVIGHELRTPAASIKMLLEELELDRQSEQVATLREQTDHLLDVLDDVRILVNPDRVYQSEERILLLKPVVERAIQALQPLAQESGLQVSFATDEGADKAYKLNPQILRQLVLNLIRNACFHSGATLLAVTLRTREVDDLSSKIMIRFEDNGRGVPESFKAKLFQPFHRADNESQGMGLGLSICETLVKKLYGRISYEDSPTGGATFVVEMELTPGDLLIDTVSDKPIRDESVEVVATHTAVEKPDEQTDEQPFDWESLHILLAEDNATIRMLTQKMLEKRGAKVTSGEDGALALTAFDQAQINFVLTDIFMPNMDGYALSAALRKRDYKGPIIGISAAVVGEETEHLVEAGADTVLSKPIDMDRLETVIQSFAERIQPLDGSASER